MNSKELVAAVFRGEKTEQIAVNHRGFSSRSASHILGREAFVGGGIQQWREAKALFEGWHDEFLERSFRDAIDLASATGQDLVRPTYWRAPNKPTRQVDEHTFLYETGDENNWKFLRYYPESEQTNIDYVHRRNLGLEDLKEHVERLEKAAEAYRPEPENFSFHIRAQEHYGSDKAIEVSGVSVGIPIRDASIWLETMLLDPGIVRSLIQHQVIWAEKNVEFLNSYGFKYFLGGLDFASEQGPMFSPKKFEELIMPGIKAVSAICRKFGVHHLFASDGNLWPVAEMLFGRSGIDGYYEIDRKAGMDLKTLRQRYPALTLLGNISSWTLSRGSSDDVKKEVLSCLDDAKQYGGIITGITNQMLPETPPANIDMMLETIEKNR